MLLSFTLPGLFAFRTIACCILVFRPSYNPRMAFIHHPDFLIVNVNVNVNVFSFVDEIGIG